MRDIRNLNLEKAAVFSLVFSVAIVIQIPTALNFSAGTLRTQTAYVMTIFHS